MLDTVRVVLAEQLPGLQLVYEAVTDDRQTVWEERLRQLADEQDVSIILTISGVGPTDSIPDATVAVCPKRFPGFGTLLRQTALLITPAALLWRNTAGLRQQTLIVNLPNSPDAIRVGLPQLFPGIPNAVRLAGGPTV